MSRLYERISTTILEGDSKETPGLIKQALDEGLVPKDILDNGLVVGMNEVGDRFERCEMFVPSVLLAAKAMQNGLEVLRPRLVEIGIKPIGKIVLGTVLGDIHDIGKNLVGMLCEGAGFEVINLGFDTHPDKFVNAIKDHQPDIVGMSAMLTTTMLNMGHTIKAMEEVGIDISGYGSKDVDTFGDLAFDYVVTLCDNARESCPFFPALRQLQQDSGKRQHLDLH